MGNSISLQVLSMTSEGSKCSCVSPPLPHTPLQLRWEECVNLLAAFSVIWPRHPNSKTPSTYLLAKWQEEKWSPHKAGVGIKQTIFFFFGSVKGTTTIKCRETGRCSFEISTISVPG